MTLSSVRNDGASAAFAQPATEPSAGRHALGRRKGVIRVHQLVRALSPAPSAVDDAQIASPPTVTHFPSRLIERRDHLAEQLTVARAEVQALSALLREARLELKQERTASRSLQDVAAKVSAELGRLRTDAERARGDAAGARAEVVEARAEVVEARAEAVDAGAEADAAFVELRATYAALSAAEARIAELETSQPQQRLP